MIQRTKAWLKNAANRLFMRREIWEARTDLKALIGKIDRMTVAIQILEDGQEIADKKFRHLSGRIDAYAELEDQFRASVSALLGQLAENDERLLQAADAGQAAIDNRFGNLDDKASTIAAQGEAAATGLARLGQELGGTAQSLELILDRTGAQATADRQRAAALAALEALLQEGQEKVRRAEASLKGRLDELRESYLQLARLRVQDAIKTGEIGTVAEGNTRLLREIAARGDLMNDNTIRTRDEILDRLAGIENQAATNGAASDSTRLGILAELENLRGAAESSAALQDRAASELAEIRTMGGEIVDRLARIGEDTGVLGEAGETARTDIVGRLEAFREAFGQVAERQEHATAGLADRTASELAEIRAMGADIVDRLKAFREAFGQVTERQEHATTGLADRTASELAEIRTMGGDIVDRLARIGEDTGALGEAGETARADIVGRLDTFREAFAQVAERQEHATAGLADRTASELAEIRAMGGEIVDRVVRIGQDTGALGEAGETARTDIVGRLEAFREAFGQVAERQEHATAGLADMSASWQSELLAPLRSTEERIVEVIEILRRSEETANGYAPLHERAVANTEELLKRLHEFDNRLATVQEASLDDRTRTLVEEVSQAIAQVADAQRSDTARLAELQKLGHAVHAGLQDLSLDAGILASDRQRVDTLMVELDGKMAKVVEAPAALKESLAGIDDALDRLDKSIAKGPEQTATRVKKIEENEFRQVESLLALDRHLGLRTPLPFTRGWAASPDLLLYFYNFIVEHRPKVIVELGSGVSSLVAAAALRATGQGFLHSLDHDADYGSATSRLVEANELTAFARVHHAPLGAWSPPLETALGEGWQWYTVPEAVAALKSIDLLIVDGPPKAVGDNSRYPAVPHFDRQLAPGATVLLDDARRPGEQAAVQAWHSELGYVHRTEKGYEKGLTILVKPAANKRPKGPRPAA